MTPVESIELNALDEAEKLPAANQRSYAALIAVQALNAFNDNFVKMLLVAFAGVVAKGTDLGDSLQIYLGVVFLLPYLLFAPVAGWLSDRFSKQRVIFWMQVFQVVIFCLFHVALWLRQAQVSLWLSLGCFFMLATQSAIFSPAKFGIMKELVGSRRLGPASGTLQMTNFMGILGGMGLAGWWFGSMIQGQAAPGENPVAWDAVNFLIGVTTVIALLQIAGSWLIMRTPERGEMKFYQGLWTEHFSHLKLLFSQRPLKLATLGISYFWLMSNGVGAILVTLSHELHPNDGAAAAKAMSMMPAMLGIGVMAGSLIAGWVCRRRIEMGLVPLSGYLLAATLLWSGLTPFNPWINFALIAVGAAGGMFMTPLYAFVQDRSKPEERARIMSAVNLMDCLFSALSLGVVKLMLGLGLSAPTQLLVMVPITLVTAVYITKLLPRGFLFLVSRWLVKMFYHIKAWHPERMKKDGGVLLLPNHVSYADALMLGAAAPREIRFVMLDTLYQIKAINWGLKIFGTVPISSTKPREAIRTVGEALKNQQAVVLFPEGQLTRTGFLNQLHKGFELMARLGGGAKVQPVWLDGMWGSVFSFDGGKFFKKMPKQFRYSAGVAFGEPMEASEATAVRVREKLSELSLECFVRRVSKMKALPEVSRVAWVNGLRVLGTSLLDGIHTIVCLWPRDHVMGQTFGVALPEMRKLKVSWVETAETEGVLVVSGVITVAGMSAGTRRLRLLGSGEFAGARVRVSGAEAGCFDEKTGTLLGFCVPHPLMPVGEEDEQIGWQEGSFGHVLNALSVKEEADALVLGGLGGELNEELRLTAVRLDEKGFLMPRVAETA